MSLSYVIKEGTAGIARARLAAFTSIFSLFIAVLLMGTLARLGYNGYEVAQSLKKSIEIEVFLVDLDEHTTDKLEDHFKQQELVQQVSYISKDSAAAVFEKEFGSEGSSLADLKFLPASFRLSIDSDAPVSRVDSLVQQIDKLRGIDEVRFNQQLLKQIQSNFRTVAMVGGGVGILILLASMILVFNTIRLTIYAKRNLIKAMKLVGATNSFIRRPFVVEGVIQGFIAGVLAVLVVYAGFHYILPDYIPQFGVLAWPFGRWYYLVGAMMLLSVFMGFVGSQWAARKFIRETSISE